MKHKKYSFMKEIKVYMCALFIVFLFVKMENNNFFKRNKTYFPCLHSPVKTLAKIVRIFEQVKTLTDLLSNSPKSLPRVFSRSNRVSYFTPNKNPNSRICSSSSRPVLIRFCPHWRGWPASPHSRHDHLHIFTSFHHFDQLRASSFFKPIFLISSSSSTSFDQGLSP